VRNAILFFAIVLGLLPIAARAETYRFQLGGWSMSSQTGQFNQNPWSTDLGLALETPTTIWEPIHLATNDTLYFVGFCPRDNVDSTFNYGVSVQDLTIPTSAASQSFTMTAHLHDSAEYIFPVFENAWDSFAIDPGQTYTIPLPNGSSVTVQQNNMGWLTMHGDSGSDITWSGHILTLHAVPAPGLNGVSPGTVQAGVSNGLTINGSNLYPGYTHVVMSASNYAWGLDDTLQGGNLAPSFNIPSDYCDDYVHVQLYNLGPGATRSAVINVPCLPSTPTLSSTSNNIVTSSGEQILTVNGSNFAPCLHGLINSSAGVQADYLSSSQCLVHIPAWAAACPGTFIVQVYNQNGTGTETSNAALVSVAPAPCSLSSIASSVPVNSTGNTVTVYGTNYNQCVTAYVNGEACTTTFLSTGAINIAVPDDQITSIGQVPVWVSVPGQGNTNVIYLNVVGPAPTVTSIAPTSVMLNSTGNTIDVYGANYYAGGISTVQFDGNPLTTTFVDSGHLQGAVPDSFCVAGASHTITVFNSGLYGGGSNGATYNVNNPAPTLTSLSIASFPVGRASQTITITGTGFLAGAVVNLDATPAGPTDTITPTTVTPTSVVFTAPAADIAAVGTVKISVSNPTPTVGPSNTLTFSLTALPANVTASVTVVTTSGPTYNPISGLWSITRKITNTGGVTITGPIQLVYNSITPGAVMTNATGTVFGNPYKTATPGNLAPAASVSVTAGFSWPGPGGFTFTNTVYAGNF
jgi:hypothetical protein